MTGYPDHPDPHPTVKRFVQYLAERRLGLLCAIVRSTIPSRTPWALAPAVLMVAVLRALECDDEVIRRLLGQAALDLERDFLRRADPANPLITLLDEDRN